MNTLYRTALVALAAACLTAGPLAVAQEEDNVRRLDRQGKDGDHTYWQVRCNDGKKASVVINDVTLELCAMPLGKEPKCAENDQVWTVKKAAAFACR